MLVDRLWPRGLAKDRADIDAWERVIAPSDELRRWYGHDPARFAEFTKRYQTELADPVRQEAVERLRQLMLDGPLTLLTATRDIDHSQAAVLADLLGSS